MPKHKVKATIWIDLAGSAMVVAVLGTVTWYVVSVMPRASRQEEAVLRTEQATRAQLAQSSVALEGSQEKLAKLQSHLEKEGQLPNRTPIDEFQTKLALLARQNDIEITRYLPLSAQDYPGLLETRVTYDSTGTTPDVIRFLRAIEAEKTFWADVAYFSIEPKGQVERGNPVESSLSFVISLFSSRSNMPVDGA